MHAFISSVLHERRRAEALELLDLFGSTTGLEPVMWGDSLIGYGSYRYKYASGREGEFFLTGFSPRKSALTIYIMPGFESYKDQLARLGKHKHSRSCLYLTRLDAVDQSVLAEIIGDSVDWMRRKYPI